MIRLSLACLALCVAAAPALAADVTVTLKGVEARGGEVSGVLNTAGTFMRGADYIARAPGDAPGDIVLTFRDVAPGEYALMVMHDANGNGRFDMGPTGMPDEGFAFSNKGLPLMGMPTFEGLKFTVGTDGVTLVEPMTYMSPR
ncbi:DUF2141 domain-containing protein [uncultured Brevundimonas sp.]|uniref:DUF2141 domain-containing protein n=1 Tax=uncultured Brevundimonas sp. TaxID=213418 RepID=UPI0030EF8FC2|tara:strand:- start:126 stop:554 length:429 start_codon:yes stop_codon:yes gene_type:complete